MKARKRLKTTLHEAQFSFNALIDERGRLRFVKLSTNKYFQVLLSLNIDHAQVFPDNFFFEVGNNKDSQKWRNPQKTKKKNQAFFLQIRLSFSIQDDALK